MEVTVQIPFEQLVRIVKQLEPDQKAKLQRELTETEVKTFSKENSLKQLLIKGPVFTEEQIKTIEKTRKSINQWRTKS